MLPVRSISFRFVVVLDGELLAPSTDPRCNTSVKVCVTPGDTKLRWSLDGKETRRASHTVAGFELRGRRHLEYTKHRESQQMVSLGARYINKAVPR